jgi:hypothetical protein
MNRPASKASLTPRPMSAPHPGGGNGKEPPPAPHSGGGNGKGPIDPRRLKFKEIAGKRTAAVLHTLEVLTQLAENAHRSHYIAYEQDFVEIETALQGALDKCMEAFRRGQRKPTFDLSTD